MVLICFVCILSGISPTEIEVRSPPFNVTITGENFVDSGYIQCVDELNLNSFEGFFINATSIQCLIPTFNQSVRLQLRVIFSETNNQPPEGVNTEVELDVFALEPSPVSITLKDDLFSVVIKYNATVEPVSANDADNCSLYLDNNSNGVKWNEQVGDAHCYFIDGDSLIVELGIYATLEPSAMIALKGGAVRARGETITKPRTENKELLVQGPTNPPVPDVVIEGGESYG